MISKLLHYVLYNPWLWESGKKPGGIQFLTWRFLVPLKMVKLLCQSIKKIFQWGLLIYFLGNIQKKFIQNLFWLQRYRLKQVDNCIILNFGQNESPECSFNMTRKLELFYGDLTMKINQILNIIIILKQFEGLGMLELLVNCFKCLLEGTTQSHRANIFFVEMKYFIQCINHFTIIKG